MSTSFDPTPNKPHKRKGGPSQDGAPNPTHGRILTPKGIAIFIAVILAGVACFALWRNVSQTIEQDRIAQEEAQRQRDLEAEIAGRDPHVERIIGELTLEQKIAQLFVVRPEAITDVDVAIAAGDATRDALTKYPVGGICYFAGNLQTPKQTTEMLRNSQNYTKDACGIPLFTCVDEEGGTVVRIADNEAFDATNVGNMRDIGATGDPERARDAAFTMGTYLKELGFNVDFAPVADIVTSEDETMGKRSFGSTPDEVTPMVLAQIEAFSRAGVLCCVKHFPGIGGAEGDSHNERIYSHQSAEEMLQGPLVPFKAAIEHGAPMIMVGHLSCLGISGNDVPASLDPNIIRSMLREQLGYKGVIITDSLEMEAATSACEDDEQAVKAVEAGADLFLMPKDFKKAYQGLLDAVKSGRIEEGRIDESLRRIIAAKLKIGA